MALRALDPSLLNPTPAPLVNIMRDGMPTTTSTRIIEPPTSAQLADRQAEVQAKITPEANAALFWAMSYAGQAGLPRPYVDFLAEYKTGRRYINMFGLDPNTIFDNMRNFGINYPTTYSAIEKTIFSPAMADQNQAAAWAIDSMASVYRNYRLEPENRAAILIAPFEPGDVVIAASGQWDQLPLHYLLRLSWDSYLKNGFVYAPYEPSAQTINQLMPLPGITGALKETGQAAVRVVADGMGAVADVVSTEIGDIIRDNPVITSIVTGLAVTLLVRWLTSNK